jgi:hypothetical protein
MGGGSPLNSKSGGLNVACYSPLQAWRGRTVNKETGKRPLAFRKMEGFADMEVKIPCGKCLGCKMDYSRTWALRCVHEAKGYKDNCFITLTYNEEHLPTDKSLSKREITLFMKRLRKVAGNGIKFFACGEYGSKMLRPHYHLCIFGYDFPDKILWNKRDRVHLYRSAILEKLWKKGFSTVGEVTFESAAYVTRYITKKQMASNDSSIYEIYSHVNGGVILEPEFTQMSRGGGKGKHGIGYAWYQRFKDDLRKGYILEGGHKVSIPRYYQNLMEKHDGALYRETKAKAKAVCKKNEENGEGDIRRLDAKIEVQKAKLNLLKREYENDD